MLAKRLSVSYNTEVEVDWDIALVRDGISAMHRSMISQSEQHQNCSCCYVMPRLFIISIFGTCYPHDLNFALP